MSKNLTPRQIEGLLNDEISEESENEAVFPEQLSDLSDSQVEVSDHDRESEEEPGEDSENDSPDDVDRQTVSSSNAFYGKNRYKWGKTPPRRRVASSST